MHRTDLTTRLDDRLRTTDFTDIDASANGHQVSGPEAVDHVAVAVDAARATIATAVDAGADLLLTHHGLVWDGLDRVTGRTYERLEPLFDGDCGLYVSHLPLDAHPELGNAAGLCDLLSVRDREPFGAMGGEHLGLAGTLAEPSTPADLAGTLEAGLDTGGRDVQVLDLGPDRIEDVAVLTGSGADWLDEAADAGVDAYITGEGKQALYHEAREAGVTVLLAGHYATETFGVRALGDLVAEWGVETTWIDHPTGL